jgi:hypothetical protein
MADVSLPEDLSPYSTEELRQLWRQHFGREAPARASRPFMLGNLNYQRHCQIHGGLSEGTIKHLHAIALESFKDRPSARYKVMMPGTKFVRIWQGEPHEVMVTEDRTLLYRGQTFTSLSAVASHIAGTKWNGLTFFGLKKAALNGS